jgi:hypothetical protein
VTFPIYSHVHSVMMKRPSDGFSGAGEGGKQRIRQRSKRQDGAHGGNNSAGDGAANSSSGAHEYGQKQQQLQQQNTPQAGSPDWVGAPGQQHNGSPQGDGARSPQSLTLPQQLSQALAQLQGRRAVDSELIPLLNPAIPPAVWREGLNQASNHFARTAHVALTQRTVGRDYCSYSMHAYD